MLRIIIAFENYADLPIEALTGRGDFLGYGKFTGYGRPGIKSSIKPCRNSVNGKFPGFGRKHHTYYIVKPPE